MNAELESADRYRELATASRAERKRAFAAGTKPDLAELDGWEFIGWNTSWLTGVLGFRKFVKAFFASGAESAYGCNCPTEQNALEDTWQAKPSEDEPGWFGFYAIAPAPPRRGDALLLDYGRGRNGFPSRLLRDYVVRVSPDDDDILLGKAYLALGPLQLPVTYFVLAKRRPAPAPPSFPGS